MSVLPRSRTGQSDDGLATDVTADDTRTAGAHHRRKPGRKTWTVVGVVAAITGALTRDRWLPKVRRTS